MIATGTTLACGMSICLAVFTGDAHAIDNDVPQPMTFEFGEWRIIVQPGRSAPKPHNAATPAVTEVEEPSPRIQLTGFHQVPPAPTPPEAAIDAALVPATQDSLSPAPGVNSVPVTDARPSLASPSVDPVARVRQYREIYNSIPFSRAEFNANQSYRHEATMEILFGQMRSTVISRQRTSINVQSPAQPRVLPYYNWYGIHNAWSPYSYPPYRW